MEDTLRGLIDTYKTLNDECLNPCFNGRYSQSYPSFFNKSAVEVS